MIIMLLIYQSYKIVLCPLFAVLPVGPLKGAGVNAAYAVDAPGKICG